MRTQNTLLPVDSPFFYPYPLVDPIEEKSTTHPRFLLVDDDPIFCHTMRRLAETNQISMTVCQSLGDVYSVAHSDGYDVLIVDYLFGEFTALQVLDLLKQDKPIILVSQLDSSKIMRGEWPKTITQFVPKTRGPLIILTEAIAALNKVAPHGPTGTSDIQGSVHPLKDSDIFFLIRVILGVAILLALSIGLALFFASSFKKPLLWDKAPLSPEIQYSSNSLPQNSLNVAAEPGGTSP